MTWRVEGRWRPSRLVLARLVRASVAGCVLAGVACGQDLTPRACWPAPNGVQLAIIGYSHVWGDVLFDPWIPLYGVESKSPDGWSWTTHHEREAIA